MSTEGNSYEAVDFGHQDNPPPYDNATSRYEQSLPVMDTTQPTFYPPPPDYLEVLSESQPGGMVNPPSPPPPYPGPPPPQEMVISLPQPNNNRKIFQKPLPMNNPEFLTTQISEPTEPEAFPSPPPTMIPRMMPPLQDPQNCPVPGTMIVNTVQPMVVTTQTTVIPTQKPHCKEYMVWSFVNLIFCCFICGIAALIYSAKTSSSKMNQDWESAKKYSCVALVCNLAATLLGSAIVIVLIVPLTLH
ncbi:hypothetical protein AB205_0029790 [Aquarana catesbeiana]|uniref:Uncharacterized protein n=1 Tax=Aquarana catesbeiana TaxID=8400 RepID=A0A2G9RYG4_AQUCT|nr:hypothetical protein AB205_0029790 [Aquarana catesbeiana]